MNLIYLVPLSGIIALIFVYVKNRWVASNDVGSEDPYAGPAIDPNTGNAPLPAE